MSDALPMSTSRRIAAYRSQGGRRNDRALTPAQYRRAAKKAAARYGGHRANRGATILAAIRTEALAP